MVGGSGSLAYRIHLWEKRLQSEIVAIYAEIPNLCSCSRVVKEWFDGKRWLWCGVNKQCILFIVIWCLVQKTAVELAPVSLLTTRLLSSCFAILQGKPRFADVLVGACIREGPEIIRSYIGSTDKRIIEFEATKPSIVIGPVRVSYDIYNYIKFPRSPNRPLDIVKSAAGFNIDDVIELAVTIIVDLDLDPLARVVDDVDPGGQYQLVCATQSFLAVKSRRVKLKAFHSIV